MTRITIAILAGALALATAARAAPDPAGLPATAADDPNAADVRCVVVAFGLSQSPDPQVKALAGAASLYYAGRLQGRSPGLDLESAFVQQAGRIAPEDFRGELQRCSRELQAEGAALKAIGEDLKKRADAAAAAPK